MESPPLINLDNTNDEFLNFLIQKLDHDSASYPQNLSLNLLSPFIRGIYESRQKPVFHNERSKSEIEESIDQLSEDSSISDSVKSLLSLDENSERASVIYKDFSTNSLSRSHIDRGAHSSILFQALEIADDNKLPLIQIHTHPDQLGFSFLDIAITLLNIFPQGSVLHARVVNGVFILTTTFQYLILPSTKTPIITKKSDVVDLLASLNELLASRNLNSRFQLKDNDNEQFIGISNHQHLEQIKILERMVERSELSISEAAIKTIAMIPNYKEQLIPISETLKQIIIENDSKDVFYEIANFFDLILYRSSDFEHFERISVKDINL